MWNKNRSVRNGGGGGFKGGWGGNNGNGNGNNWNRDRRGGNNNNNNNNNNKYNNINEDEPPAKKPHEDLTIPKPGRSVTPSFGPEIDLSKPTVPGRPVTPETSKTPQPQGHHAGDDNYGEYDDDYVEEHHPEDEGGSYEDEEEEAAAEAAAAAAGAAEEPKGEPIKNYRVSKENVEQLEKRGIKTFFPIQSATYDYIYDGKDIVGRAQTGSGKTLSFVLPVVEKIMAENPSSAAWRVRGRYPKVLCIAPTRELARQNAEEFERCTAHTGMKTVLVYGGTQIIPQCKELYYGSDIIVGTPGRIIDLIERNALNLSSIKFSILDEADEMLSFGFAEDVEKILGKVPTGEAAPQNILFSATMPRWVLDVTKKHLREDHITVDLVGTRGTQRKVPEGVKHYAMCCPKASKADILRNILTIHKDAILEGSRTIVFTATKSEADTLLAALSATVNCKTIHGDISQAQREHTLKDFRDGKFSTLIATDVAARGLDISGVDRVIMSQPPKDVESYIHRSGRTGRAGKEGISITLYQRDDARLLHIIQRAAGFKFQRIGAPQASSLIKVSLPGVLEQLEKVPAVLSDQFEDDAKAFADKCGGELPALARALALLAKAPTAAEAHSALGGLPGFQTVLMRTHNPLPHKGVAIGILRSYLPQGVDPREVSLCSEGAVFDVLHSVAEGLVKTRGRRDVVGFEIVTDLPKDVEIPPIDDSRRGGFASAGRFGGGGFGGNGGFGRNGGGGRGNGGGGGFGGNGGHGRNGNGSSGGYGGGNNGRNGYNRNSGGGNNGRNGYNRNSGGFGRN